MLTVRSFLRLFSGFEALLLPRFPGLLPIDHPAVDHPAAPSWKEGLPAPCHPPVVVSPHFLPVPPLPSYLLQSPSCRVGSASCGPRAKSGPLPVVNKVLSGQSRAHFLPVLCGSLCATVPKASSAFGAAQPARLRLLSVHLQKVRQLLGWCDQSVSGAATPVSLGRKAGEGHIVFSLVPRCPVLDWSRQSVHGGVES